MAAPITHIILTEKVFDIYFSDKDKKSFFVGTSFPDIRYLGTIDRKETHYTDMTLREVQEETDSFTAGMKFHSLVDERREDFMQSQNIYEYIPESSQKTRALKILEDSVLYDMFKDWETCSMYFDDPLPQEGERGVSRKVIQKWHTMLQAYFAQKPTRESISTFIEHIPFPNPPSVAKEITELVSVMSELPVVTEIIKGLYTNFDFLITSHESSTTSRS